MAWKAYYDDCEWIRNLNYELTLTGRIEGTDITQ